MWSSMSVTLHAMYFEGTEKKIELIAKGAEFRKKPEIYWHGLVEMAGAKVLSKISNEVCDAYLLSESSLFVWDDRITMITCGRTTLVRAVTYLLDTTPSADLDFLAYERKNEFLKLIIEVKNTLLILRVLLYQTFNLKLLYLYLYFRERNRTIEMQQIVMVQNQKIHNKEIFQV